MYVCFIKTWRAKHVTEWQRGKSFLRKNLCKPRIINNMALIFIAKGLTMWRSTVFEDQLCNFRKKNYKIMFLVIISLKLNRFKALVNQTFVEHSQWIYQASVLTSQINSRVIKLFTLVYWLHFCPWTVAAFCQVDKKPNCYNSSVSRKTAEQTICIGWWTIHRIF